MSCVHVHLYVLRVPLAERVSVGFMPPTVHGLDRVDRARTNGNGTIWVRGEHGARTGGRSLRCSAFQAEPGNEEDVHVYLYVWIVPISRTR